MQQRKINITWNVYELSDFDFLRKSLNLKLQSTIMRVRTLFTDTDPSCSYSQFCHLLQQHFYVILEFGILEYCHDAININFSHFFGHWGHVWNYFPPFFSEFELVLVRWILSCCFFSLLHEVNWNLIFDFNESALRLELLFLTL